MSNERVVWQGDGIRVLADGTWWFFGQNLREWLPASDGNEPQTDALARALAESEAKRAKLEDFATRFARDVDAADAEEPTTVPMFALRHWAREAKKALEP